MICSVMLRSCGKAGGPFQFHPHTLYSDRILLTSYSPILTVRALTAEDRMLNTWRNWPSSRSATACVLLGEIKFNSIQLCSGRVNPELTAETSFIERLMVHSKTAISPPPLLRPRVAHLDKLACKDCSSLAKMSLLSFCGVRFLFWF